MKRNKYVFIMIIVMLLLSGCTVTENVNVSSSGKTKEEIKILSATSEISENNTIVNNYLDSIIDKYRKAFSAKGYSYDKIIDMDKESGLKVNKDYDNICNFVNNTGFSQYLYKKITCQETEYYYEIKSEGENIFYCPGCSDFPHIDKINLNINLPVKAEEDNADDVSGNTYTWIYDKDTSKSKSIYLKINKETIKERNKEEKKEIKKSKSISNIMIIGGIIIVLLLIGVVAYTLYKRYKSNKLDY